MALPDTGMTIFGSPNPVRKEPKWLRHNFSKEGLENPVFGPQTPLPSFGIYST